MPSLRAVTQVAECCSPDQPITAGHWYAARVRSQQERKVQGALIAAGIDEFLPIYREEVRWSDRTKVVERALFPGYIFCRLADPLPVLRISGVVQILGSNLTPLAIPDREIANVRAVCASLAKAAPCAYVVGQPVVIASGPLAGIEGVIKRVKGALRLIVAIELLGRGMSVEIDAGDVE
jgi:transcription antitermination factor NusG